MIDYDALNECVAKSGVTREKLAEFCGVTVPTLRLRMNGETDWKIAEVYGFAKNLHLTKKDINRIFFASRS